MSSILTASQQEERLEYFVGSVLDNFSMTICLVNYLVEHHARKLPPPKATIHFSGLWEPATIPGTNCGFFVNPVMTMAGVDCRRSLEFFGLKLDQKLNVLVPIRNRRSSDDLGIEAFGLPLVTKAQFLAITSPVLSKPVEPVVCKVHVWVGKQLAHFTHVTDIITMQAIRDTSLIMIEAYMHLLFEALGRPRPQLNPSV